MLTIPTVKSGKDDSGRPLCAGVTYRLYQNHEPPGADMKAIWSGAGWLDVKSKRPIRLTEDLFADPGVLCPIS